MKKLLSSIALLAVSCSAAAQTNEEEPTRWALGVGAVIGDSPYAGEGARVTPFPWVIYEGERFYFRGWEAGWRLVSTDAFELSVIASPRLDGFDIKDLGRVELASNGLDYRLLDDRDDSIDAGVSASWEGSAGEVEVQLVSDVTDRSGGQAATIEYGYPIQWGKSRVTPIVGASWMSKDMANYYFGTLDEEVARGVTSYKPGAVTIPIVGINYTRPLGKKWMVMANVKYRLLPDKIQDSPFMEPDTKGAASVLVGFARGF
jgi:MipA family protein